MSFTLPDVGANPDGWGPAPIAADRTRDPAFPVFRKDDRLGRVADWTAPMGFAARFQRAGATEEDSFQLVDNTRLAPRQLFPSRQPRRFGQRPFQQQQQQQSQRSWGTGSAGRMRQQQQQGGMRQRRFGQGPQRWSRDRQPRLRQSHVDVRPDWQVVDQISFSGLTKLPPDEEYGAEDLVKCGQLEFYQKDFERISVRAPKPLEQIEGRNVYRVTTTEDPVIQRLAHEDAGTIFATDAILALLMVCPRTVYPWDIIVQKVDGKLFLDKRDNSQFDFLTVGETMAEPPVDEPENINGMQLLSQEATFINQNFSQQVLKRGGKTVTFEEPNPFAEEGESVAPIGYTYRRWNLGDDLRLVARCEIDAAGEPREGGEPQLLSVKAVNEYDLKLSGDWRRTLETQRAAVLAQEMKNNSGKMARWAAQALLAGVDAIKLGYVSRTTPKNNHSHQILAVQSIKPAEFATQMNLSVRSMWAVLRSFLHLFMKLDNGKYVLIKDANKPLARLYQVPPDTFDDMDEMAEEGDVAGPAPDADLDEVDADL